MASNEQGDVLTRHLEAEQQAAIARYEGPVRRARAALYWLALYQFVLDLVIGLSARAWVGGLIRIFLGALEAGIFVLLAVYTRRRPLVALLLGTIFILAFWLYYVLFYEFSPFNGGLLTLVFLAPLLLALPSARKLEQVLRHPTDPGSTQR